MDSAKAAGVLASHGGQMRDYKAPYTMDEASLPIVAVPTTAGTGSEATKVTIITDSDSQEKMLCMGLAYLPVAAVVDYELTLSKPWRLTADTGIDALCHAMEAYVSGKHNLFSDALALQSLSAIGSSLRTCCYKPHDHAARERMMLASTHAGMAFSNSSVTLIHGMSRPIGASYHVPHGLSNAMLAPAVTAFGISGATRRYADVARALEMCAVGVSDEDAAEGLVRELYALNTELEVPKLADWTGVDKTAFLASVPSMAAAALASGSPNNNPVVPRQDEIEALYSSIFAEQ
jgi:alcohol dehydrogenase class IV